MRKSWSIKQYLPSIFTSFSLFLGIYAIANPSGYRILPMMAVLLATIPDYLDGSIARRTGTQSDFGAFFDSLSDMVVFGLAPAILYHRYYLTAYGNWGFALICAYVLATACRLARFNSAPKNMLHFTGMPCPAAAAMCVSFLWLNEQTGIFWQYTGLGVFIMALCTYLQISTWPFLSLKSLDKKTIQGKCILVILLLTLLALPLNPPLALVALFSLYILISLGMTIQKKCSALQKRRQLN